MFIEFWSDLRFRLRALFRRADVERELDDELRFHLEREAEKLSDAGMSARGRGRAAHDSRSAASIGSRTTRATRAASTFIEHVLQDVKLRAARTARAARVHRRRRRDAWAWRRRQRGDVRHARPHAVPRAALSDRSAIGAPRVLTRHERAGPADVRAQPRVHSATTTCALDDAPISHAAAFAYRNDGRRRRRGDAGARRRDRQRDLLRLLQCAAGARPLLHGAGGLAARRRPPSPCSATASGRRAMRRGRDVLGKSLRVGTRIYTIIGVAPPGFEGVSDERAPIAFIPVTAFAASVARRFLSRTTAGAGSTFSFGASRVSASAARPPI